MAVLVAVLAAVTMVYALNQPLQTQALVAVAVVKVVLVTGLAAAVQASSLYVINYKELLWHIMQKS
jgi:uncharacterized membrane protein (DUF441 family)